MGSILLGQLLFPGDNITIRIKEQSNKAIFERVKLGVTIANKASAIIIRYNQTNVRAFFTKGLTSLIFTVVSTN